MRSYLVANYQSIPNYGGLFLKPAHVLQVQPKFRTTSESLSSFVLPHVFVFVCILGFSICFLYYLFITHFSWFQTQSTRALRLVGTMSGNRILEESLSCGCLTVVTCYMVFGEHFDFGSLGEYDLTFYFLSEANQWTM